MPDDPAPAYGLARCSGDGSCPVRYRSGPDRPCPQHQLEVNNSIAALMSRGTTLADFWGEDPGGTAAED